DQAVVVFYDLRPQPPSLRLRHLRAPLPTQPRAGLCRPSTKLLVKSHHYRFMTDKFSGKIGSSVPTGAAVSGRIEAERDFDFEWIGQHRGNDRQRLRTADRIDRRLIKHRRAGARLDPNAE